MPQIRFNMNPAEQTQALTQQRDFVVGCFESFLMQFMQPELPDSLLEYFGTLPVTVQNTFRNALKYHTPVPNRIVDILSQSRRAPNFLRYFVSGNDNGTPTAQPFVQPSYADSTAKVQRLGMKMAMLEASFPAEVSAQEPKKPLSAVDIHAVLLEVTLEAEEGQFAAPVVEVYADEVQTGVPTPAEVPANEFFPATNTAAATVLETNNRSETGKLSFLWPIKSIYRRLLHLCSRIGNMIRPPGLAVPLVAQFQSSCQQHLYWAPPIHMGAPLFRNTRPSITHSSQFPLTAFG